MTHLIESDADTSRISPSTARRRFAFVGTGYRVKMFLDPAASLYAKDVEIVGLCDLSGVRLSYHQKRLRERFGYREVPAYAASDFHRMLRETRPDCVVICTIDSQHDHYAVEAMKFGCDVVTEKPMTIDEVRCRRILQAAGETGRSLRVTFNYRWAPGATKVRELLASGVIGTVRQVNLEYLLNTRHGADYFRRWHSEKQNSGGLLIHKSTHHFDLVNWWLDAVPESVFARGGLFFYGKQNAISRGDEHLARYPRYFGQPVNGDPFSFSFIDQNSDEKDYEENIYRLAEDETGYIRDRNVFRDGISIEDVMNVMVRYRTRVLLNYSLNAFSPREGYRVTFTGDRGRIEYEEDHAEHVLEKSQSRGEDHAHAGPHRLRVQPHFKSGYDVPVKAGAGGHGGGDPLLQEQIFSPEPTVDVFGRSAGHEQGAASILVGIAANHSMNESRPVEISSLVNLRPDARRLSELI